MLVESLIKSTVELQGFRVIDVRKVDDGLKSALTRSQHLFAYEKADVYRLAAAYACGIIRNHPFVDGNKRTGLVVAATFFLLNGDDDTTRCRRNSRELNR